ncbi:MAG TPA: branched-chain amino acid ABC transporter permease [Acidimicrobiia bacterium]|nr:branched-chain amino acid ABC transporter permease [Acidimicrobiia bacterium]
MTLGKLRIHPLALFAAALYVLPFAVVFSGRSAINASEFLVWGVFAMGLNLLWGHTGDLSFGHGMFYGWGAYTAGWVARQSDDAVGVGLNIAFVPVNLLASAVVAMLIAWPLAKIIVRRATGIYFAMITLAIGEMFFFLAIRMTKITGGENGLGGIQLGDLPGVDLTRPSMFYFMTATVTFLMVLAAWRIVHSPFGRVCRSIQQNRGRVPFLGFDAVRYRERAFVLSAGICGVAGGLSALLFRHVAADTLRWTTTGEAVLITMLGGLQSFFGPIAGAVSVKYLEATLIARPEPWANKYWPGVIGAIFAVFVLVAPGGLAGVAQRIRSLLGRASSATAAPPAARPEETAA